MNLQSQFDQAMLNIYDEAEKLGYRPTRFLQMVYELGGLQTAQRLLGGNVTSSGFERLWEMGRPDLTVEYLVLQEPWCRLFTDDELKEAERRLA